VYLNIKTIGNHHKQQHEGVFKVAAACPECKQHSMDLNPAEYAVQESQQHSLSQPTDKSPDFCPSQNHTCLS
jgi:hypothetical protein